MRIDWACGHFILTALVLATASAPCVLAADTSCSAMTVRGAYLFTMDGFLLSTKVPLFQAMTPAVTAGLQNEAPGTPVSAAGLLILNGDGTGTVQETVNLSFSVSTVNRTVNYSLGNDCRGTIALSICPKGACSDSSAIVADSKGEDIRFLNTVPGTSIKGFMNRVPDRSPGQSCSLATVAGATYRFDTGGFSVWSNGNGGKASFDVPFNTAGIVNIAGDGSSVWLDAFTLAGNVLDPRGPYSAQFSINADCSGMLVEGAAIYTGADGKRFVLVSSVPGAVYNGRFDRQL